MSVGYNRPVTGGYPIRYPRTQYNPTIVGSGLVYATGSSVAYWSRIADDTMMIQGGLTVGASSAATALSITLPTVDGLQLTINSSVLPFGGSTTNPQQAIFGLGDWLQQGIGWNRISFGFATATTFDINMSTQKLNGNQLGPSDGIKYVVFIPIKEWS